jgi:hypothetical protein
MISLTAPRRTVQFYWLLIGTLCVWRITHLLSAEDGPANIFGWLRRRAGNGFWSRLLVCFYCLSLWISIPFAFLIGKGAREIALLWLALSGAASLLERATSKAPVFQTYLEENEEEVTVVEQPNQSENDQSR